MPKVTKKEEEVSEAPKERLVVEEEQKAPVVEAPTPVVVTEPVVETPPIPEAVEMVEEKKSAPKWLLFLIGLIIGLVLGVGVVLAWGMYSNSKTEPKEAESMTPETTPVAEVATVTPTPELVRSKLKVRVENGGGVSGAALVGSEYLKGLGYDVVSIGNSSVSVKLTEVKLVTGKKEFGQLLLKDLGSKYQVASSAGELTGVTDYDALVTVGE